MRLQILSDVHIDVMDVHGLSLAPDVDALLIAGDVCEGLDRGMAWLRATFGDEVPIVFVAGNHEYFAKVRPSERQAGALAASAHNIAFLDDATVVMGGVRFIGSTLWADYALYGEHRRDEMMAIASRRMMDHRRILEAPDRFITPEESLALHRASRAFLARELRKPHDGPTVVVSHHAPHPRSLAEKHRENLVSACFISNLSEIIDAHQPTLWVHGHTHVCLDYAAGATRIVCNPHGYGGENPAFNPALVVEV